jgi:hypothetical protein
MKELDERIQESLLYEKRRKKWCLMRERNKKLFSNQQK